jgi:RNA polymerase primary sigma factor
MRERQVIKMFFGIAVESKLSLGDIGADLGISRERVRQIKDKAINKLSAHPAIRLLVPYLG